MTGQFPTTDPPLLHTLSFAMPERPPALQHSVVGCSTKDNPDVVDVKSLAISTHSLLSPSHLERGEGDVVPSKSYIWNLPPEILGVVFWYCLDSQSGFLHLERPLVLLTLVCKEWRNVVFATPQLWTSICVVDSTQHQVGKPWLARSGCLPINLAIMLYSQDPRVTGDQDFSDLMCCLSQNYYRIRRLSLLVFSTPSSFHRFLPQDSQSSMPLLETLEFCGSQISIQNLGTIDAPRLRSISVAEHIQHIPRIFPNSLSSLTNLQLTSLQTSVVEVCNVLAACPALVNCVTKFSCMLRPSSTEQVSLPYLQSLRVQYSQNDDPLIDFLQVLQLPNLRSLRITFRHFPFFSQEDDFITHFAILDLSTLASENGLNFSKLTRLSLSDLNMVGSRWISFFRVLTRLEELEMKDCIGPDRVLEALAEDDGLCPLLRNVRFVWCFTLESLCILTPCVNCEGGHDYGVDGDEEGVDLEVGDGEDNTISSGGVEASANIPLIDGDPVDVIVHPELDEEFETFNGTNNSKRVQKGRCNATFNDQLEYMKVLRDASLQLTIGPLLYEVGERRGLGVEADWEHYQYSLV